MQQQGMAALEHFLSKCDRLIVLLSDRYFGRLWCVYELATFCRAHSVHDVLFLSIDWAGQEVWWKWLNPMQWVGLFTSNSSSEQLDQRERNMLLDFRCRDAHCTRPVDKAVLLSKIREQWGSEMAFEAFVRNDLVKALAEGKRSFANRRRQVVAETFALLFGGS